MTHFRPRSNSSFMAMASICQDWRQSWWLRLRWIYHFWKMDFNSCSLCSIQTSSCDELCLCWYSPNSHRTKTEIESQTSHRNELIIIPTSGLLPVPVKWFLLIYQFLGYLTIIVQKFLKSTRSTKELQKDDLEIFLTFQHLKGDNFWKIM